MGACQSKQQMIEDAGTVLTDDNLPQWAKRLNEIPLPKYMQGDSLIDVYFKYNQLVNGYEVTARWRTFGKDVETGSVLLNFYGKFIIHTILIMWFLPKTSKGIAGVMFIISTTPLLILWTTLRQTMEILL